MARRYLDWLDQARADLKAARDSLADSNVEWCAFQCQQAAEKAAEALLRYHNLEVPGHSIFVLLQRAQEFVKVPEQLRRSAQSLDSHYILAPYPNGFPEGHPRMFYNEDAARTCLEGADELVRFVEGQVS